MKLEKLIKREISITLAVVLLVTTLFIMFSYAIFKVDATSESNSITFGDISMSFCASADCDNTINNMGNIIGTETIDGATSYVPIYPQKDPQTEAEWGELKPYTFSLTNTGTIDLYITLYLKKDTAVSIPLEGQTLTPCGENGSQNCIEESQLVNDNQIKIAIGEQGLTPTIKIFKDTQVAEGENNYKIAENIFIPAGEKKIFNYYAWLTENAENASQGKYFITLISARGEYLPKEDYQVTFDSNGGTMVENQIVESRNKVIEPESPTKEGFTFVGWFTSLTDENAYDFNTEVISNFTLTAKWTDNSSTVQEGNKTEQTETPTE